MGNFNNRTRQAVTSYLNEYYTESDLQIFYQKYFPQLVGQPIYKVVGANTNVGGSAGIEAALDVDYITTIGAGVLTEFWWFPGYNTNATANLVTQCEPYLDFLHALDNTADPPFIFSTSYGEDENQVSFAYEQRVHQEFMKHGLR